MSLNMNQRLVLKTGLICIGFFIILAAVTVLIFFKSVEFDNEKRFKVVISSDEVRAGDVITESMVAYKTIKESSYTENMLTSIDEVIGKKALSYIGKEDYIRYYELLPKDRWYGEDSRTIVLKMEPEERLANLIKKGSLIDIKVKLSGVDAVPQTVLSKVRVEDIINELGENMGGKAMGKDIYGVFILDSNQRNRVYVAKNLGKLMYELYCNQTQNSLVEDFKIPEEYFMER